MKQISVNLQKKLDSFTPFSPDEWLCNIITGINANEDVNVQNLFEIGKDIVQKMDGQSVFSYSHKLSLKAKTLASSKNLNVSADRSIDPALLFQRFLVVSQTGDLRLDDVMSYEICPYRTQIFLFSCSSMQMFLNVLHSISALTRRNPMSITSRLSSRFLVKPCAAIYCLCMPLRDAIRCPGYLGLERSWGFNESSTEKSQ